jgi:hypothetical protein
MPLPVYVKGNKFSLVLHGKCYPEAVCARFAAEQGAYMEKPMQKKGSYTIVPLKVSSLQDALERANYLLFLTR